MAWIIALVGCGKTKPVISHKSETLLCIASGGFAIGCGKQEIQRQATKQEAATEQHDNNIIAADENQEDCIGN